MNNNNNNKGIIKTSSGRSSLAEERLSDIKRRSIYDNNKRTKNAYENGKKEGLKEGFIRGALAGFAVISALTFGYNGIVKLTHKYPVNISFETATESYHKNSNITSDNKGYWVDFDKVARSYNPEEMDIDSFLYGVFCGLCNVGEETRLEDMNTLVHHLYMSNKTEYSSFVLYCEARGLCYEEDGKLKIDVDKYKKALRDYMEDYGKRMETDQNIEEFKEGKKK